VDSKSQVIVVSGDPTRTQCCKVGDADLGLEGQHFGCGDVSEGKEKQGERWGGSHRGG
jgi:hypothetical protein